jgi:hypothetical protein
MELGCVAVFDGGMKEHLSSVLWYSQIEFRRLDFAFYSTTGAAASGIRETSTQTKIPLISVRVTCGPIWNYKDTDGLH